ncbi:MAG: hypothetical protein R2716_06180 [Microthrixaceae bacterium]
MAPSTGTAKKGRTKASSKSTPKRSSRAVLRDVEPGSSVECVHCGERVKFAAKMRHKQVICNVYVRGRWDRVEHYHADCYGEAGEPHGEVDTSAPLRQRATSSRAS